MVRASVEQARTASSGTRVASDAFRDVLGHLPTGVTVVAGVHDGTPVGLTVGTFGALSLDPPLVLLCPAKSSITWPQIERSGTFCANVLATAQTDLSERFARRAEEKFSGLQWRPARSGCPVLVDAVAWIDCAVADVFDGGDHLIVVGRVLDLGLGSRRSPLVFFRGGYLTVASVDGALQAAS